MILLTDRTTVTTDWRCGRARYWYKEAEGGGIVSAEDAIELQDGADFHADMHAIAAGDYADEQIVLGGNTQSEKERWARRAGTAAAFKEWVWPQVLKSYKPLKLEGELVLKHGDLWMASTPDAILLAHDESYAIVDDYKSFSAWDTTKWAAHWPYAIQMHVQLKAAADEYGLPIKHGRVRGIVKGQVKDGLLRHPYVWAYSNGEDLWQLDYKYGLDLRPTWEYPGGPAAWALKLGPEVGFGLFPLSQPIFLNEALLERFLRRVESREREIHDWKLLPEGDRNLMMDQVFEPRYEQCRPEWGRACPYLAACHNAAVSASPLESGLYVKRVPHHELELIDLEE